MKEQRARRWVADGALFIRLDRPNLFTNSEIVGWIFPETILKMRLVLFGIRIPFWMERRGRQLKVGDELDDAKIVEILTTDPAEGKQ